MTQMVVRLSEDSSLLLTANCYLGTPIGWSEGGIGAPIKVIMGQMVRFIGFACRYPPDLKLTRGKT